MKRRSLLLGTLAAIGAAVMPKRFRREVTQSYHGLNGLAGAAPDHEYYSDGHRWHSVPTYLCVGTDTPWPDWDVWDRKTGKRVDFVMEVDTERGWIRRLNTDRDGKWCCNNYGQEPFRSTIGTHYETGSFELRPAPSFSS